MEANELSLFDENQNFIKIIYYKLTIIKLAYHNLSHPFYVSSNRWHEIGKKKFKAYSLPQIDQWHKVIFPLNT